MNVALTAGVVLAGLAATAVVLTTFQHPPVTTIQEGPRGVALAVNYDPNLVLASLDNNRIPPSLPKLPASGPKAGVAYKNVQVLGDLSVGQFTRLMASMTTWVSPQAGCGYCHNVKNMAEDTLYTKVVARRMLQMTQHINANWQTHVAGVGVTCWTCHRGNNVPKNIWFQDRGPAANLGGMAESYTGKNLASAASGDASLPYDPFTPYLSSDPANIRVQGAQPLPTTETDHSIKQAEWTYALMMHFSNALGVNCTYCHNSRAFGDWTQSSPQRTTAWYGIRMVRDLNVDYLTPLTGVFPAYRLGQAGDAPKVNCTTCHQGIYKPLYGVSMVQNFPELTHSTVLAASPAAAVPPVTPAPGTATP